MVTRVEVWENEKSCGSFKLIVMETRKESFLYLLLKKKKNGKFSILPQSYGKWLSTNQRARGILFVLENSFECLLHQAI